MLWSVLAGERVRTVGEVISRCAGSGTEPSMSIDMAMVSRSARCCLYLWSLGCYGSPSVQIGRRAYFSKL